ncbi:prepilin-type N-terminal cleavage/methylation domain-containing protein [Eubacterium aggregans]|uniref:Prepilin-type N-terminal cleavage/methylation domain-containing protein n=1 Tax=Eubacterium aggregans TaxID=81409 RepID=A0A1H4AFF5_9FIRM|nr:prepilin-type N-terminal cleavage/methylation domain-containing protein [Eubacterium aggregans]SEA34813.1 prepilin-type N-terminal cleavage/methylation domain-containing protein [Eubacterium aggregans]
MQLWKKMKKNRKGFTLVEIIVVLVILAILAAFTIPAMLGFVNDARSKASIAQAREIYVAAQAASTEVAAGKATPALETGVSTTANSDAATVATKTTNMITNDINVAPLVTVGDITPDNITAAKKATKRADIPTAPYVYVNAKAEVTDVFFNGIHLKSGGETETY